MITKPEKGSRVTLNGIEMVVEDSSLCELPGCFPMLDVTLAEAPKEKPPMGIKPQWLHNYDRLIDLLDSCERYSESKLPCDPLWIVEIRELIKKRHVVAREHL